MSTDLENLREKLENEAMRKSDAMRHFLKLRLKSNFGSHAMKLKVWDALKSLRVLVLNSKPKLLKMKSLLMFSRPKLPMPKSQRVDLDQTLMISMEYERVHAAALITEKRAKNFDKVLGEWLSKANDVQAEVAASQDEGRNY